MLGEFGHFLAGLGARDVRTQSYEGVDLDATRAG